MAPVPRQCSHPGLRRLQRRPDGPGRARRGGPAGPVPRAASSAAAAGSAGQRLRALLHAAAPAKPTPPCASFCGPAADRTSDRLYAAPPPRRRVQAAQSDLLGAHPELPHFAGHRQREAGGEADVLRNLAVRDPPPAELAAVLLGGCRSLAELAPSEDLLSEALVRNADDVNIGDPGMLVEALLDLAGVDVLAAPDGASPQPGR